MANGTRRDGSVLLYKVKEGEEARLTQRGIVVCHPDRPPKLVHFDGSEEPLALAMIGDALDE